MLSSVSNRITPQSYKHQEWWKPKTTRSTGSASLPVSCKISLRLSTGSGTRCWYSNYHCLVSRERWPSGIPQRAILTLLLYDIYTTDIPVNDGNLKRLMPTDDTALILYSRDFNKGVRYPQQAISGWKIEWINGRSRSICRRSGLLISTENQSRPGSNWK